MRDDNSDADDKYVTFKRADLHELLDVNLERWGELKNIEVHDAVVIRRQDLFASPALFTYAHSISIAARLSDVPTRRRLQAIADYFMRQAELAGDEGYKIPD